MRGNWGMSSWKIDVYVSQNAFSWGGGVKTYGVAGILVGGGERVVENCVLWCCWHSWEGGGVKRMVERGVGETYQIFGLQKSKSGPIQNPERSSTIACTELCFAPGRLW